MTDDEVFAKFRGLAAGVITPATAERMISQVMELETLDDPADLVEFATMAGQ
jgi:ATP-dependent RNA circularization protein (DNA/RNA ligase family)